MDLIVSKYTMIYLYVRDIITELNTVVNHVSGEISIIKKTWIHKWVIPAYVKAVTVFFLIPITSSHVSHSKTPLLSL